MIDENLVDVLLREESDPCQEILVDDDVVIIGISQSLSVPSRNGTETCSKDCP